VTSENRHRGCGRDMLGQTVPSTGSSNREGLIASDYGTIQCTCVLNYIDQQSLKPDDDYVLPHQRLWTFDALICPLSVTAFPVAAARLWNSLPSHVTAAPLSPSSVVVLNHISSHFLTLLCGSSLICTGPTQ